MNIQIDKDSPEDCYYSCPFQDGSMCRLFNENLENTGYYDSVSYEACWHCQQMYNDQCGGKL